MTAVGINDILVTTLQTTVGTAVTFANTAAFLAANWDLIAYDEDGVVLAAQPTWSLVKSDADGRAQFKVATEYAAVRWLLEIPSGFYASVTDWTVRGYTYSIDDLGSTIASVGSITLSPTATSSAATIYDGDSILVEGIVIPEAALTAIGASSLANCDSRKSFIKLASADSNDTPPVIDTDLTVTATTDASENRVVKVTRDDFPAALGVPDDADSLSCVLMVILIKGVKQITAARVDITVRWTADTGEATP